MLRRRAFLRGGHHLGDEAADVGRRQRHEEVACVEARDVEERVDDPREPLRLRRDVAQERAPLLLSEENVLAQQRLGEPVDRGQRRPELMRHS